MHPPEGTSENAMVLDGWSEIHIIAPTPGTCPVCATKHDPQAPHDKESLYYVSQFFRKNKRLPSWEDAMSHCTEPVKAEFRKKLAKRGIVSAPAVSRE